MVAVQRFSYQTSRHDILKIRRTCNTIVHMRLEKRQIYECYEDQLRSFKCVSSAVECRTRNRESAGSNSIPVAAVAKSRHFRSRHNAVVHSAV